MEAKKQKQMMRQPVKTTRKRLHNTNAYAVTTRERTRHSLLKKHAWWIGGLPPVRSVLTGQAHRYTVFDRGGSTRVR